MKEKGKTRREPVVPNWRGWRWNRAWHRYVHSRLQAVLPGLTYCWSICTCLCPTYLCLFPSSFGLMCTHSCLLVCVLVPASPHVYVLIPIHLCQLLAHLACVWPPFALICAHAPHLFVLVPIFIWPLLGLIFAPLASCLCLYQIHIS